MSLPKLESENEGNARPVPHTEDRSNLFRNYGNDRPMVNTPSIPELAKHNALRNRDFRRSHRLRQRRYPESD